MKHTEQVTSDKCGLPEECQITSGKNRSATLETQSHSFTAATFFGCSSVQKCTLLHCTIQCTVQLLLQSTLSKRGEHREHLTLAHLTHTHTHRHTSADTSTLHIPWCAQKETHRVGGRKNSVTCRGKFRLGTVASACTYSCHIHIGGHIVSRWQTVSPESSGRNSRSSHHQSEM